MDVQAFLDYQQRSPTTPVSSASDAELPDVRDLPRPSHQSRQHANTNRKPKRKTETPGSIGRQARQQRQGTSTKRSIPEGKQDRTQMEGALDSLLPGDRREPSSPAGDPIEPPSPDKIGPRSPEP